MLDLGYLGLPEKYIDDKDDFYRSGITEAPKIRSLCSTCQRIFVTRSSNIRLYLLGEKDIYRVDVFGGDKRLIAQLYYLPKQFRLDIFDGENPESPLFIWKSKKCVYSGVQKILKTIKVETLLLPLVSVL